MSPKSAAGSTFCPEMTELSFLYDSSSYALYVDSKSSWMYSALM